MPLRHADPTLFLNTVSINYYFILTMDRSATVNHDHV